MKASRPIRKAIPKNIKVVVRLFQNGLCGCRKRCGVKLPPDGKGLVEYQHEPALALRAVSWDGSDYEPPQHDPRYIFAELKDCHKTETYHPRSKATSLGSDRHAIDKTRRLRGELKPRPKKKWPAGRKIAPRPFPQRKS